MRNKSYKPPRPASVRERLEPAGYDPEFLYVECGRCGAPVVWEPGRATTLLRCAGVDPLELDASCLLLTDACPACGVGPEFTVRVFRVGGEGFPHPAGRA